MAMQVADVAEFLAGKRYDELLMDGLDPVDAAWQAAEEFGLVVNGRDVDAMAPRWAELAASAEYEHPRYDAEGPAIQ